MSERKYQFIKQNDEPIPIMCEPEDEWNMETFLSRQREEPCYKTWFWWDREKHYIDEFVRVHGNPWLGTTLYDDFPEYIHGMEANEYYHPLFIEVVGGEYVNVYEEKEK